jgi:hypothetical protein
MKPLPDSKYVPDRTVPAGDLSKVRARCIGSVGTADRRLIVEISEPNVADLPVVSIVFAVISTQSAGAVAL